MLDLRHRRQYLVDIYPVGWIVAGVARSAEHWLSTTRFKQSVERQIDERVGFDKTANLIDVVFRGDKVLLARRVHTVETRRRCRRATDAQMHFLRTRRAHHADDLSAGGAADDGVIDKNDALAGEQIAYRVELQLHAKVAHALLRLNESAADI